MERQPVKAVGIGFRRNATVTSVLDALARAGMQDHRRLALPASKAGQPLAGPLRDLGFCLVPVADDLLPLQDTLTESAAARRTHATGSVAEACALAVLGPGAVLLGPRIISGDGRATVAIAMKGPRT